MGYLANRAADVPEAVKAPATNLTLGSAGAATLATLATAYNDTFHSIFGDTAGPDVKAAVLIAVIAAWALIAVADIFGRAISKAATERAPATTTAVMTMLPIAVIATNLDGKDRNGFLAVAVRGADGEEEVLLVKSGEPAAWVARRNLDFPD